MNVPEGVSWKSGHSAKVSNRNMIIWKATVKNSGPKFFQVHGFWIYLYEKNTLVSVLGKIGPELSEGLNPLLLSGIRWKEK